MPFADAELRCRDLKRRHRPDPRQGRRLCRDHARAAPRGPHPTCRRHHPAPGLRGRKRNIDLWPVESPGLCWKQSTQAASCDGFTRMSKTAISIDTYARAPHSNTLRRKAEKFGAAAAQPSKSDQNDLRHEPLQYTEPATCTIFGKRPSSEDDCRYWSRPSGSANGFSKRSKGWWRANRSRGAESLGGICSLQIELAEAGAERDATNIQIYYRQQPTNKSASSSDRNHRLGGSGSAPYRRLRHIQVRPRCLSSSAPRRRLSSWTPMPYIAACSRAPRLRRCHHPPPSAVGQVRLLGYEGAAAAAPYRVPRLCHHTRDIRGRELAGLPHNPPR